MEETWRMSDMNETADRTYLYASGNVLSQSVHDYSPFGLEIVPTETSGNTHRFTGQERDPETGNDYMHYRYYADSLGRFMAPDNISGTIINPQDWNLYSYVHGNPITFNDPTGHIATNPNIGPGNQEELHRSEDLFESTGDGVDLVAGWGVNAFMNIVTTNVYDANKNLLASVSVATIESEPLLPAASSRTQTTSQTDKSKKAKQVDDIPSKFVIEHSKTQKAPTWSWFYYLLENAEGDSLKGKGYCVYEIIFNVEPARPVITSKKKCTPVTNGEVRDKVGYTVMGRDSNSFTCDQTFKVMYKGHPYYPTTEFQHITTVTRNKNGVVTVTNNVNVVVP